MHAIRTDEKLWKQIKDDLKKSTKYGGPGWNARKSQAAVKKYISMGGKYKKTVPKNQTSMHKWTQEKWDYISKSKNTRYLPLKVRQQLTKKEIQTEYRKKHNKKGKKVAYSKSVKTKMKNSGIF